MLDKSRRALRELFTRASVGQSRDTGLAAALVCLILAYFWHLEGLLPAAILLLLLAMLWPDIYRPAAVLWFGLARLMGAVFSRVVLFILFFGLVTPVGLLRRWWGADPLLLKKWKTGGDSVFVVRDAKISPDDLERPY